jgi:DNA-directed RNA polymerase specialized sigma24 family protein
MRITDAFPPEDDPLRAAFLAAAEEFVQRYRWGLADAATLAALALRAYRERFPADAAGAAAPDVVRVTLRGAYAARLYAACQQADDEKLRAAALGELYTYLLALARRLNADGAEDLAWTTLSNIFMSLPQIREPRAFFHTCRLKLLETARGLRPREREVPVPPDTARDAETGRVGDRDCLDQLLAEIRQLPPALQQVIAGQLEGLSDEELAGRLGKTPQNIRVLRFRARAQLRARPSLDGCL